MKTLDFVNGLDIRDIRNANKFISEYKDKEMLPYKVISFDDMTGIEDKRGHTYYGGNKKVKFDDIGGYDVEVEFWGMPYKNSKRTLNEMDYYSALITLTSEDVVEGDYEFALDLSNNLLVAGAKIAHRISSEKTNKRDSDFVKLFWLSNMIDHIRKAFSSVNMNSINE